MSYGRSPIILSPEFISRKAIEEVLQRPSDIRLMQQSVEEYKDLLGKELLFSKTDPNMHITILSLKKKMSISNYQLFADELKEQYPNSKLIRHISGVLKTTNISSARDALLDFHTLQKIVQEYEKQKTQRERQHSDKSKTYGGFYDPPGANVGQNHFFQTVQTAHHTSHPGISSHQHDKITQRVSPMDPVYLHDQKLYPAEMYKQLEQRSSQQSEDISNLQKELREKKIEVDELRNRLSSLASKKLTEGNPDFTDLSDKNRPMKIAEMFHHIYDDEWTTALEKLTHTKKGSETKTEEEAIKLLMDIIKRAYTFCVNYASQQQKNLTALWHLCLDDPFLSDSPVDMKSIASTKSVPAVIISEFKICQKTENKTCLEKVVQKFRTNALRDLVKSSNPALEAYMDKCVEALWLMVVQDPPMVIHWPEERSKFDNTAYKEYCRKGTYVKLPVWPAVYLHKNGALMSKGYVMPQ